MNRIKRLFSKQSSQPSAQAPNAHEDAVRRAVKETLTTYEKTFTDLARYDRGEPITHTVPH